MSRPISLGLAAMLLVVLAARPHLAFAHEGIVVGDYTLEYGWLSEPPIAGQPNAIVLNVIGADSSAEADPPAPAGAGPLLITQPADGTAVEGDRLDVTVALAQDSPADSHHWHLYVDGRLATMVPIETPTYTLSGLTNGRHALAVALSDSKHQDVGARSQVSIQVSGSSAGDAPQAGASAVDLSQLTVEIVYGSQARMLVFRPAASGQPGQYQAPLTPGRAGQYTLRLSGSLAGTPVSAEVEPEEVLQADAVAFPSTASTGSDAAGAALYAGIAGIVLGLAGVALGGAALLRRR